MTVVGIIAGWIGWMLFICIIVFAIVGLATNGKFDNTVVWTKTLWAILAILMLAIQIYNITFNAHPEDYGYTEIIEVTEGE